MEHFSGFRGKNAKKNPKLFYYFVLFSLYISLFLILNSYWEDAGRGGVNPDATSPHNTLQTPHSMSSDPPPLRILTELVSPPPTV